MANSARNVTKPNSRACLACRSKHLRCDGGNPRCTRCYDTGSECVYVQSRRGLRNTPKQLTASVALPHLSPAGNQINGSTTNQLIDSTQSTLFETATEISSTEDIGSFTYRDADDQNLDQLITTYYATIHPAHPFLLPKTIFTQNRSAFPDHLVATMRFISSHYSAIDPESLRSSANMVYGTVPDDVFKVQSLILLTLASYARFERDAGNKALLTATEVALRIGLNSNDHLPAQPGNNVLRESCRRTWWELYTISGLISLISGMKYQLPLAKDLLLPIDDEQYNQCGDVRNIGSIETMQERFIAEDDQLWSSLAYRIEAMRILNEVQETVSSKASTNELEAINAAITSFLLSVPKDKEEGLKTTGEVDEIMSCALMVIHLARICLHMKQSDIVTVRGLSTVCGNESITAVSSNRQVSHRAACVGSAKEVATLISTRTTLKTLSPCFSCALAYSAIVQLAECRLGSPNQRMMREQLNMLLSALKLLSKTWPIAAVVRGQIAQFSREIFTPPRPPTSSMQLDMSGENWMQELLAEDLQMYQDGFSLMGV